MNQRYLVTFCLLSVLASGCTRVEVRKNPPACDTGVRYYRPKPYLFISPKKAKPASKSAFTVTQGKPIEVKVTQVPAPKDSSIILSNYAQVENPISNLPAPEQAPVENAEQIEPQDTAPKPAEGAEQSTTTEASVVEVGIEMVYMPDFAEEYSVKLKPGLGIGELSLELEDGWNLTSIGMKTDQQTDEIISSVAEVVSAAGSAFASQKATKIGKDNNVYATNIPFGFYEAVIATDPCGNKQLYGWRYIGFMPFQSCPIKTGGMIPTCCDDPSNIIYGLAFVNNVLQFAPISSIPPQPVNNN